MSIFQKVSHSATTVSLPEVKDYTVIIIIKKGRKSEVKCFILEFKFRGLAEIVRV